MFEGFYKRLPLDGIDKEGFDRGVLLGEVRMFGVCVELRGIDQRIGHDRLPVGVQRVMFACVAQGVEGLCAPECRIAARLHVGGLVRMLGVSFYEATDFIIYLFNAIYFLIFYIFQYVAPKRITLIICLSNCGKYFCLILRTGVFIETGVF